MIIQCPKCLTKFKLDDSKISDEGTRVRCTKCKEVFVAKREVAPPPPPPVQHEVPAEKDEFDFSFGPSFGEEEKEPEKKEEAPFQFSGGFEEETPKEEEPQKKEEFVDEAPFSFGEPTPEEPMTSGKEEPGSDWGGSMSYGEVNLSDSSTETTASPLGFDYKEEEEKPFGDFEFKEEPISETSFVAPTVAPVAPSPPIELPKFKEREEVQPPPPPTETYEDEPSSGLEEEGFSEEFQEEFKKEERAPFIKKGLIALVLVAVLAIGGWAVWKNFKASESGVINLEDMNGSYAQNAENGSIFVISGKAVNNTNKSRSFFQVKGVLFNKKGERLAQKEVFCGNIFSSKELATLSRAKIEADLMNKVGGSLSNINLAPGKAVPFMIVFFDLPSDMSEFSVESTGSHMASE